MQSTVPSRSFANTAKLREEPHARAAYAEQVADHLCTVLAKTSTEACLEDAKATAHHTVED